MTFSTEKSCYTNNKFKFFSVDSAFCQPKSGRVVRFNWKKLKCEVISSAIPVWVVIKKIGWGHQTVTSTFRTQFIEHIPFTTFLPDNGYQTKMYKIDLDTPTYN